LIKCPTVQPMPFFITIKRNFQLKSLIVKVL
jgi:hypothetical protein